MPNRLSVDGDCLGLEPRAIKVLVFLLMRAPLVVSSYELLNLYWPRGATDQRKVTKRISEIRSALGDTARKPRFIETVSKQGYRVIGSVSRVPLRLQDEGSLPLGDPSDQEDGFDYIWSLAAANESDRSDFDASKNDSIAHESYMRAVSLMGTQDFHFSWLPRAISALEETISLDSNHADAWARFGLLNVIKAVRLDASYIQVAQKAASTAMSINDQHPHALTLMAYIALLHEWDAERADLYLSKALSISPDD